MVLTRNRVSTCGWLLGPWRWITSGRSHCRNPIEPEIKNKKGKRSKRHYTFQFASGLVGCKMIETRYDSIP